MLAVAPKHVSLLTLACICCYLEELNNKVRLREMGMSSVCMYLVIKVLDKLHFDMGLVT